MIRFGMAFMATATLALAAGWAQSAPLYANGFEADTAGWFAASRVSSGTGGVTSADGGYHATAGTGSVYTTYGGYNFGAGGGVPTAFQSYRTSIDIYLNVDAGLANNTRFDFSSAINNAAGNHRRDFIFNAGFFTDATGPGANTNRFVVSASNNSQPGSAYPKNPDRSPIAIDSTGWYTFQHTFYEAAGLLAVDMEIFDATDALVGSWTLGDPTDAIGLIGGNRYGWFSYNQLGAGMAFDNVSLELQQAAVPEPGSLALAGLALAGLAAARRRGG